MRDLAHSQPLPKSWQDKAVIVLSLLAVVSPWLLGYSGNALATGNAVVVGLIMASGAAAVLLKPPYWPDFFSAFFGFWLALSPRILGFADQLAAALPAYVIGAAVAVLAIWASVVRAHALLAGDNVVGFTPPARPPISPDRPKKAA